MGETRDGWGKAEVIIGALGALGSIAIPIMLFVVGNRISERQAQDSALQLQADRVERMLGHLASTNADERLLAVKVVKYFSGSDQAFPEALIPILIEVASSDAQEDVAASASNALEKVAKGSQGPAATAAQTALSTMPARVNVRAPTDDTRVAAATATVAQSDVVVTKQQAASSAEVPQGTAELRYFRMEDKAQAQQLASKLLQKGIRANVVDLSAKKTGPSRPRNFDLVLGKE